MNEAYVWWATAIVYTVGMVVTAYLLGRYYPSFPREGTDVVGICVCWPLIVTFGVVVSPLCALYFINCRTAEKWAARRKQEQLDREELQRFRNAALQELNGNHEENKDDNWKIN